MPRGFGFWPKLEDYFSRFSPNLLFSLYGRHFALTHSFDITPCLLSIKYMIILLDMLEDHHLLLHHLSHAFGLNSHPSKHIFRINFCFMHFVSIFSKLTPKDVKDSFVEGRERVTESSHSHVRHPKVNWLITFQISGDHLLLQKVTSRKKENKYRCVWELTSILFIICVKK